MNRITLDNIISGKIRIDDSVLVEYAMFLPGKTVVVTSDPHKWSTTRLSNPSVMFIDGPSDWIRGLRSNRVFILSDSNLSDDDINDIAAGLINVNNSPVFTTTPLYEVRFIWNVK